MSGRKGDLNIRGAFLHMAADAGVSLGVELAGFTILATGWQWIDPVVSLIVAVVILVGTWRLLCDSINLALDAVPEGIDDLLGAHVELIASAPIPTRSSFICCMRRSGTARRRLLACRPPDNQANFA